MRAHLQDGPLPRYYQLKEILREKIRGGQWAAGGPIPSERELAQEYGLSRMTARQAVAELAREGLLYRLQGKGTFVGRPRITQQLMVLTGFSQDMAARGWRPGARVLEQHMEPATPAVAARLRIPEGRLVFYACRLRLSDDEPLALESIHLSFPGCAGLLAADLAADSLYALLQERFDLQLRDAEQEIEAGLADATEARRLSVEPGAALLRMRRTTFSTAGAVVEYAESAYRGDKYTFYTRLAAPGPRGEERAP